MASNDELEDRVNTLEQQVVELQAQIDVAKEALESIVAWKFRTDNGRPMHPSPVVVIEGRDRTQELVADI